MKLFSGMLLPVFLCASLFAEGGFDDAGSFLAQKVVEKKLSNGITLLMADMGYSPVLSFVISFKVGSSDETYRTMGAAHLLEHMLFKGTDVIGTKDFKKEKPILDKIEAVGETLDVLKLRNPANELIPQLEKRLAELQKEHSALVVSSPYDKLYSERGGVGFNASTSKDKTEYYISLPASELELWAKTESERLRNPVMREYYLERANVLEERLMRYDSTGGGLLFEAFIAQAFASHPYRHPIIGWGSNIPYLSIKDVREFYYTRYIPSRMSIVIVGKQNVDETFRIVEKYFSSIGRAPEPKDINVAEGKQLGEKRFEINYEANPEIIIGWHKPTYPSKDDYALDVFADIAAGGKSSKLYKALVIERKLAHSVMAWNGAPGARYNNLFAIFAEPAGGVSPYELEKAIYEELDRAVSSITDKDIEIVKNQIESNALLSLSSNSKLASTLSYYQTVFGDWRYFANYHKAVSNITVKDISEAYKKYFVKENRSVGVLNNTGKGDANEEP
ncbi:MAG: insulinase family protein [Leptospirales bacterium]|nr:insulinase family protein [Leptospirales bacterium]